MQKSSKALDLSSLFFRDIIEDIVDMKTRISHKKPEDIISPKKVKIEELKSDKDIFRELLLRRNKKLSEEEINQSIQYLYDRWIDIDSLKKLWKLSKSYFSDELEKKWFFHLFDLIFDEQVPYFTKNKKIDELNDELSKKIAKSKDEIFEEEFFDDIHMPEIFNPEEYLENISKLTKKQKKEALEKFYLNYKKQLDTLASIPNKIKENIKKYDFAILSDEELIKLLIWDIKEEFMFLSKEQRISVIKKIEIFIDKRRKVLSYINNYYYKNSPKSLLATIYAIPLWDIEWDVSFEDWWTSLVFYINDNETFLNAYNWFNDVKFESSEKVAGFYTQKDKCDIAVINTSLENSSTENIKIHELRHAKNKIIMQDYPVNDYLNNAKDEIIAYLRDWVRTIDEIMSVLALKSDEMWLYDYYKKYKTNFEYYNDIRKHYEDDLIKALYIAKYMQDLEIPNYLEILAIIPVRKWDLLKKIYKKEESGEIDDSRLRKMIKLFGEIKNMY